MTSRYRHTRPFGAGRGTSRSNAGVARVYRAGDSVEDFCRACKTDRMHTVIAADPEGRPLRVVCGYCDSEHNYRGGPRIGVDEPAGADRASSSAAASRWRAARPRAISHRQRSRKDCASHDRSLRRRRCRSRDAAAPHHPRGDRHHAGRAGREMAGRHAGAQARATPQLQEKSWPIETFFHKVVMLRNRLRTLEQQVNSDRPARGRQDQAAGLHQRLLRLADQLQRAVRGGDDQFRGAGGD